MKLAINDPTTICTTAISNVDAVLFVDAGVQAQYDSIPITSSSGLPGREASSNGSITGGHLFDATGDWDVVCGEGDLSVDDGWTLTANGDFAANSDGDATIAWDVTATATEGQPADVSGDASIALDGGGGHVNDDLSLVAKAKTGDYAAGNGSKSSVELGWGGGAHGDSSYNLGLAGDFATNADGDLETTVTQDEFDIDADAGGSGNDWLRAKYDSQSHVVTNTAAGYSTHHSETDSSDHDSVTLESDGHSNFARCGLVLLTSPRDRFLRPLVNAVGRSGDRPTTLCLSKPTGGEASGSVSFTFEGGSGDETHVLHENESKGQSNYDNGYGLTEIHKNESKSKYKLDDVYDSLYNGNASVSLAADGSVTSSGSSHYEEDYTFDQVSDSENKWSEETSSTSVVPEGYTYLQWDKWEYEHGFKTTDHYEAELSADSSSGTSSGGSTGISSVTTSETLTVSDDGYTDDEWFNKSCHTWNHNGTPGGPDCLQSTWTDHEDWPSYVDEVIAMMEMEAGAEEGGGREGSGPCATCAETGGEASEEPSGEGGTKAGSTGEQQGGYWSFWNWFIGGGFSGSQDRQLAGKQEMLSHLLNETTGSNAALRYSAEFNGQWPGAALDAAENTAIEVGVFLTPFPGDDAFMAGRRLGPTAVVPRPSTVKGIKAAGKFDDIVGSVDEARAAIKKAFPDAVELPPAIPGQPYPSPPPGVKRWFQVHPPEPGVGNNLPHIKYVDWMTGKKGTGGSWGHIFFPE